jgi:WD40 repeat protein
MICVFEDIFSSKKKDVDASYKFTEHENVVEDVCWHNFNKDLFGSVGDDKYLRIWDLRKNNNKSINKVKGSNKEINCLDFSIFNENILATVKILLSFRV